jgi:hypothetical protein
MSGAPVGWRDGELALCVSREIVGRGRTVRVLQCPSCETTVRCPVCPLNFHVTCSNCSKGLRYDLGTLARAAVRGASRVTPECRRGPIVRILFMPSPSLALPLHCADAHAGGVSFYALALVPFPPSADATDSAVILKVDGAAQVRDLGCVRLARESRGAPRSPRACASVRDRAPSKPARVRSRRSSACLAGRSAHRPVPAMRRAQTVTLSQPGASKPFIVLEMDELDDVIAGFGQSHQKTHAAAVAASPRRPSAAPASAAAFLDLAIVWTRSARGEELRATEGLASAAMPPLLLLRAPNCHVCAQLVATLAGGYVARTHAPSVHKREQPVLQGQLLMGADLLWYDRLFVLNRPAGRALPQARADASDATAQSGPWPGPSAWPGPAKLLIFAADSATTPLDVLPLTGVWRLCASACAHARIPASLAAPRSRPRTRRARRAPLTRLAPRPPRRRLRRALASAADVRLLDEQPSSYQFAIVTRIEGHADADGQPHETSAAVRRSIAAGAPGWAVCEIAAPDLASKQRWLHAIKQAVREDSRHRPQPPAPSEPRAARPGATRTAAAAAVDHAQHGGLTLTLRHGGCDVLYAGPRLGRIEQLAAAFAARFGPDLRKALSRTGAADAPGAHRAAQADHAAPLRVGQVEFLLAAVGSVGSTFKLGELADGMVVLARLTVG